jgi:hypothetical protein
VEGEIAARDAARASKRNRSYGGIPASSYAPDEEMRYSQYTENGTTDKQRYSFPPSQDPRGSFSSSPQLRGKEWAYDGERDVPELYMQPSLRPNRRRGEDIEMGGFTGLTEGSLTQHNLHRNGTGKLHPMVHNFTSPIGMSSRLPSTLYAEADAFDLRFLQRRATTDTTDIRTALIHFVLSLVLFFHACNPCTYLCPKFPHSGVPLVYDTIQPTNNKSVLGYRFSIYDMSFVPSCRASSKNQATNRKKPALR